MTNKKVPVFVAKAMSECGQTQRQIGEALNVSQSTISRRINSDQK